MGKAKDYYGQAFDLHAGFCKLCWRWTEDRMTHSVLEKCIDGNNRKHGKKFAPVERPTPTEKTLITARARLDEIIAASKAIDSPYLFGNLLFSYAGGYDHRILRDQGLESQQAQEMLLDRIEQNLIDEEWLSQSTQLGSKSYKPRPSDEHSAPDAPSRNFCSEHNPRRSVKARRLYQNDRKRITAFNNEIDRLYGHYMAQGIGIHGDDHDNLRRDAYNNVFSSTLEKIKALQAEGKKQAEIARMLGITRQAVTNALIREKKRVSLANHSPATSKAKGTLNLRGAG